MENGKECVLLMYYLLFGSKADYGKIRMNDILDNTKVRYVEPPLWKKNEILEFFHKFHHSRKMNKYVDIPFKNVWYKLYYDRNFIVDNSEICFIFEEYSPHPYNIGFLNYLKQKYEKGKFVIILSNPINENSVQKLSYLKEMFDLIITWDKEDAEKYNLNYHQSHYSKLPIDANKTIKSDVFFIGAEKGRLDKILKVYELLKENGFTCDFNIVGVKDSQKVYEDEIKYNIPIPYVEVIKRVQNSKCILEILQNGQSAPTLRTLEAITYNKKLLTNNISILNETFYSKEYISVFSDVNTIDLNFLRRNIGEIDYNYYESISPKALLNFIDDYFRNVNNLY